MTEKEWLACTDPQKMLEFLHGRATDRKLRLFGVACCRHIWYKLPDGRSRNAVEVAERFADGLASETERATAECDAFNLNHYLIEMDEFYHRSHHFRDFAVFASVAAAADTLCTDAESSATSTALRTLEVMVAEPEWNPNLQGRILRDIFGNPFRPVTINPAWLTWNDGTVQKIAQAIYDERAFDRLPILADALEEAGCTDADILGHCRSGGEHVRGCWVVDLLLGKT
jgi:hypothetical protein